MGVPISAIAWFTLYPVVFLFIISTIDFLLDISTRLSKSLSMENIFLSIL